VDGWLEHQRRFFLGSAGTHGRAALNRMAAHTGDRWARRFLFGGLVMALGVFLLETLARLPGTGLSPEDPRLHLPRHVMLLIAAMGPAIAAFFTISVEKRAYDSHADTYELMGRIFERALREADTPEVRASDAEFRALMLDVGREALSENAEWLLDHRHRPIESEIG
jgi:hypothetical protein